MESKTLIHRNRSAGDRFETLTYGRFYGSFERRRELSGFSVALIGADATAVKGVSHNHESTHVIFVIEGNYLSSVFGVEQLVPGGSLIFVPAGTTHRDRLQTSSSRTLTVSVSSFQAERASHYVRLPRAQSNFRHAEISFIASRLEAECRCWVDTSALTMEGLCLELLAATAKREQTKDLNPPRWLRTASDLVRDKCRDKISIAEIAAAVGVHPIHLSRTFRKFFNCTPGDYLRNCRVQRAAALLRSGCLPIAEVALESGFSDQSQLSKAFRHTLGTSPGDFRRATR